MKLKGIPKIDRATIYLSFAMRIILLIAVARAAWVHNWLIVFISAFIFILTFLPSIIAKNVSVNLPTEFEFFAILFIFATLFLGDLNEYYLHFFWWDIMLHWFASLALGFVGFLIIFILYDRHKIRASPIVIAMFTFCFAVAIGTVWEIAEFSIDFLFQTNMQRSGLVDTMSDLIIDSVGALIIATAGYFYVKGKPSHIIRPILNNFISQNPHLYEKKEEKVKK